MTQPWTVIAQLDSAHQADVTRGFLESEGIEVRLRDDKTLATAWHLAAVVGGVRVEVPAEQAERALTLLDDLEKGAEDTESRVARLELEAARIGPEADARRALVVACLGALVPVLPSLWSLALVWRAMKGRAVWHRLVVAVLMNLVFTAGWVTLALKL